jgi:hypothetical protein
MGIGFY